MDKSLYDGLKHCWKAGYKLPKIKEYLNTDYSIEDLQELFMEMRENELSPNSWVDLNGDFMKDITFSQVEIDELVKKRSKHW